MLFPTDTLILSQYMDEFTLPFQLTVGKWTNLPVGTTLNLLNFDRNIYDYTYKYNNPTEIHEFFSNCCRSEITKINDNKLGGTCKFYSGNQLIGNDNNFTFDILTDYGFWYPINKNTDSVAVGSNEKKMFNLTDYDIQQLEAKKWWTYNSNTLIGWRGPCLEMKYLDDLSINKLYV
jgi:hypothetical protein